MERGTTSDLIRAQLRRLRTAAGLSQEEYGKRAHYAASTVSAVELGTRALDLPYLRRADEVLDTGNLFVSLFKLALRDGEPTWFRSFREAEETATQLRCFQPNLIPGLLQTEEYARAIVRLDVSLSEADVEQVVANRLARQAILEGEHPPQFIAVLDESALHRFAESCAGVMAGQLVHLLACARRPHISVHIVPASTGLHVGLAGPFTLARSAEDGWVGFLDSQTGGDNVDSPEAVATLLRVWETVRADALPRQQSIDLIERVVKPWT
nr:helix-turn-helix transcriptional regulator [Micromonospora sp. DSM 115978]